MIDADAAIDHALKRFGLPDPFADAGELAGRIEAWLLDLAPRGAYAEAIVRLAAAASLRSEQTLAKESALIAHQTTRARLAWDEDRGLDAEALGARLARSKAPALLRLQLERTDQGAAWLAARWSELADAAGSGTTWSPARRALACRLRGTGPDAEDGLPATAEAQEALARSEADRIEDLRDGKLRALDAEERGLAELGLSLAPSPPLARLQREHARWCRLLTWSLREFRRASRETASACASPPPPPPPPPPSPETDRPRAAAPAPRPPHPADPEAVAVLAFMAALDGPRAPVMPRDAFAAEVGSTASGRRAPSSAALPPDPLPTRPDPVRGRDPDRDRGPHEPRGHGPVGRPASPRIRL